MTRPTTKPRLATALAAVALLATACGGSGHLNPLSNSNNEADKRLKFTECLRRHGVNVPDPGQANGVRISMAPGQEGKVNGAMQACRSLAPGKGMAPTDPAARDHMLKLAECMRRHGLNAPDPQPGQGLMIRGTPGQDIQKIDQACQKEVGGPK